MEVIPVILQHKFDQLLGLLHDFPLREVDLHKMTQIRLFFPPSKANMFIRLQLGRNVGRKMVIALMAIVQTSVTMDLKY